MKKSLKLAFRKLMLSPVSSWKHWGIILLVAFLFIFKKQFPPSDWVLNTENLWRDGLFMYDNPDRVYPPPGRRERGGDPGGQPGPEPPPALPRREPEAEG